MLFAISVKCFFVMVFFVFCWLVIERLKPVAFDIFGECKEKIEHGKGEDRGEQVGDEFFDGVYCFHVFNLMFEGYLVKDYFSDSSGG